MSTDLNRVLHPWAFLFILNLALGDHSLINADEAEIVSQIQRSNPRNVDSLEEGTLQDQFLPTEDSDQRMEKRFVTQDRKTTDYPGDFKIKVKVPVMVEEEVPYRMFLDNAQSMKTIEQKSMYRDFLNKYLHDQKIPRHYAPFYSHVQYPDHSPIHLPLNPLPMQTKHFAYPYGEDMDTSHLPQHNLHYPLDPMMHYRKYYEKSYPTFYDKYLNHPTVHTGPSPADLLSHGHGMYPGNRNYGLWSMPPFRYHSNLQPSYEMEYPYFWPSTTLSPEYLLHQLAEEKYPLNYAELQYMEDREKAILHDLNVQRIRDSLLESAFRDHLIDGPKLHQQIFPQHDYMAEDEPRLHHSTRKTDSVDHASWDKHHLDHPYHHNDQKPKIMDYPPTTIRYHQPVYKDIASNRQPDHHSQAKDEERADSDVKHVLKTQQEMEYNYHIKHPSGSSKINPIEKERGSDTKYVTQQTVKENQGTHDQKVDVYYNGHDRTKYDDGNQSIHEDRKSNVQGAPGVHQVQESRIIIADNHRIPDHPKEGNINHKEGYPQRQPISSNPGTELTGNKRIFIPVDKEQHINVAIKHDTPPQHNKHIQSQDGSQLTSSNVAQLNKHKITEMKVISRHSPEIKNIIHVSVAEQEVKPGGLIEASKIDNIDAKRTIQVTETPEEGDQGVQKFPDLNRRMKDGFQETYIITESPIAILKHT